MPISIIISLLIVFLAYFGVSTVITLIVPYYVLDTGAPLPKAFGYLGLDWAVYPLAIGGTCALSASLLSGLFPLPRIVYSMAQDGLIFKFLSRVNKKTKTPLIATAVSGGLSAVMVLLFDLEDLVDMMSIGTLLAYTLVAACVLILRYQPSEDSELVPQSKRDDCNETKSKAFLLSNITLPLHEPTHHSGRLVYTCTMLIGVLSFVNCAILVHIESVPYLATVVFCPILGVVKILCTLIIWRQPQSTQKLSFTVPLVPFIPVLSSFCNIYLMCELSVGTWIRFGIWMVIGCAIYFGYGIKRSELQSRTGARENASEELLES